MATASTLHAQPSSSADVSDNEDALASNAASYLYHTPLERASLAATHGDVVALEEALRGCSLLETPGVPHPGALPLLHTAAKHGHVDCLAFLIAHGADLSCRAQGQTALEAALAAGQVEAVDTLERAASSLRNEQAVWLLTRHAEASSLAAAAESRAQCGRELAAATLEERRDATRGMARGEELRGAKQREAARMREACAARDRLCRLSCEYLSKCSMPDGHAPAEVTEWLRSRSAQELLLDLGESLPGVTAPDSSISGRELALAIRVVQLRLRETVCAALARPLGADDLAPLLESVLVAGQPCAAHSVSARMRTINDEVLLRNPDLASAVDGWAQACEGVQRQAIDVWRAAARSAAFFRSLARSPPPTALLMATVPQTRMRTLLDVYHSFLTQLALDESELWAGAESVHDFEQRLHSLVGTLLPQHHANDNELWATMLHASVDV